MSSVMGSARRSTVLTASSTIVALVLAILAPLVLDGHLLRVAIVVLMMAFLGQSWNIMGGYAGQFSFGHAAFFGAGAYTVAILNVEYGVNPWLGMLAAAAVGLVFGGTVGRISFRYKLKGPYFALVTLAVAESMRVLFINLSWAGGAQGILIPLGERTLGNFQFTERQMYYWVILALLVVITAFVTWMSKHRIGYYLKAIREDEIAAASLGVPADRYKVIATATSAAFAAVGGTFYAQYLLFIEPPVVFGIDFSIEMVLVALIGGFGTILGPIVGAVFLIPLGEVTRALFRDAAGMDIVTYGVVLIFFIIWAPEGIVGRFAAYRRRRAARARGIARSRQRSLSDPPAEDDPAELQEVER